MAVKKSLASVIDQFVSVHGSKYDYSQVKYVNSSSHVIIRCPVHGDFKQQPRTHIAGQGCSKCNQSINWCPKLDLQSFITRAKQVHGNKYDYSTTAYKSVNDKVQITCPTHGKFTQKANGHLNGQGCPLCAGNHKKSTQQFIAEARQIHSDKYDYTKSKYVNANTPLIITCPIHGDFLRKPKSHLTLRTGCTQCGLDRMKNELSCTTEEFISKAIKIHGDKYGYSKSIYTGKADPLIITCPLHGDFTQRPNDHISGHNGCYKCGCSSSKWEEEVKSYIASVYGGEIIDRTRTVIPPQELDIWLPDLKLGIECHGAYRHSYNAPETTSQRRRHSNKSDAADGLGITLLQFFDFEWSEKCDLLKSMINHRLGGLSIKKYARHLKITTGPASAFFDVNHLQGNKPATHTFRLEDNDRQILAAMSFSKHAKYGWEIARYAVKAGYSVTGGASRLFKEFISKANPKHVLTFADRRYSTGKLYKILGFKHVGITLPNYIYLSRCGQSFNRHSRISCQKHKLKDFLPIYSKSVTEHENMFNNGFRRLWDAGHHKLIWCAP